MPRSGNGLSPVQRQAITWTNAVLSSVLIPGKKIHNEQMNFLLKYKHFL